MNTLNSKKISNEKLNIFDIKVKIDSIRSFSFLLNEGENPKNKLKEVFNKYNLTSK